MLIVPRLTEAVIALLADDPFLVDESTVPGGIWRDLVPQEARVYPAIVVTYVLDAQNPQNALYTDVQLEVRGEFDGWDLDSLRDPMDRADALLRTAAQYPVVGNGEWDGIRFANGVRVQHVQRTTAEAGGGVLFGHLGAVYQFTCSEPPVVPVA